MDIRTGLITRNDAGLPCLPNGLPLPLASANAIMQSDAAEAAAIARAEADRGDLDGISPAGHAHMVARGVTAQSAPTPATVFARELARGRAEWKLWEQGLQVGAGGRFETTSGEPLTEVDIEPPPSAARSLTAARPDVPEEDILDAARGMHEWFVAYRARTDYAGALASARRKSEGRGETSRSQAGGGYITRGVPDAVVSVR